MDSDAITLDKDSNDLAVEEQMESMLIDLKKKKKIKVVVVDEETTVNDGGENADLADTLDFSSLKKKKKKPIATAVNALDPTRM